MQLSPRRLGTPVVLGVAVVTLAALAASSHGFPVQHVSLNDGGIWVTNNALGAVGRFTKPIAQLDGEITPASASTSVDVWQDGPVVAAYDATGGRMYAVNVYGTSFADGGTVVSPAQNGIALGDTTLAVLGTDHALRAVTLQPGGGSLAALAGTAKPLAAHLPAGSAVAVGSDDTIWVAGGGELRGYAQGAGKPVVTSLPLPASDPMRVTTVGNVPVVADPATKTLYLPDSGHKVALPSPGSSPGLELQQPSEASDVVVAATSAALYSVNLSTGQLTTLSSGHSGTVAAPVQVLGCVHAAWANGSTGSYVRTCGTPPPATAKAQAFPLGESAGTPFLVFRVNNGSVVLNDTTDGGVFLAGATPRSIKLRWTPSATAGQSKTQGQAYAQQEKTPLTAKPYTQGVRPGTTTVVHVLDAVKGRAGLTYAVIAVGAPDRPGVTVSVAPDAQTVLATVTTLATDAHFQYTVSDGRGHQATGEVTLVPRSASQNDPPRLRPGYTPPSLSVASGGTLVVPVIGDWRDFDGDPLYLVDSSVKPSAGSAAVTSGGALSLTAPQTSAGETVTLRYGVSDGRVARPTAATLKIAVLGSSSAKFVAPKAEPDAAQAMVGAPVTLHPLANDLPGVDPTSPQATLALAGPVPAVPGATVSTDEAAGTVTFTADHPGDFFLSYTDAYGAAPTASGTIRVHVIPAAGKPQPPVTTPDVAVLHGQQPALVDVLAGDYDPQGWILGVTGAASSDPGVQVVVVDQKWLRISADNPRPGLAATVKYTVSDGKGSATGTVAVSAVPANSGADQITTTDMAITVRAGDSAAVPVLSADASSLGLPLSLAGTPPTANPPVSGLLAGVQGQGIRVVAPASVRSEEETAISYVATDSDGTTAAGELDVTIMPPPSKAHPDQAPVPEEVDTRETAGDVLVVKIPVSGVDPDGDSVTVTGVTVPPTLGRIVAVGPDSISYQSYPDSAGTDTFSYQVTDPYGLTGTAQVRVAVLPPGPPQPPVAVDDVLNAPPGASLHWNVVRNDYIAPGDTVSIEPLARTNKKLPAGVRLAGDYAYLRVPSSPSGPPVEFTYGLTDGSTPSLAQVIVHPVPGAKIPPIANDDIAPPPPGGAATVTVNVLKNDDDPVGSPSDLKISWAPAGVTVHGPNLTIRLTAQPRAVPYQVTAPDGLTATAVVYVPGTKASAIRLRPGARITLKKNGSATVPLSSVLIDTSGRQPKITTTNELTASPGGDLSVSASQATAFQVHAGGGYTGPGAVTVQVYDGVTLQDPHGNTATVTIPVQVGPDAPILRCPATPLQVVEGGAARSYDIGQLCHAWVDTTVPQPPPRYTATWAKAAGGISASVPGGTSLQLSAASNATPGTTGTLRITPAGAAASGTLAVDVVKAPLPVGRPVSVAVDASRGVTVDLRQYVTSPLARPDIQVMSVTHPAGAAVTSSGATVTITPAASTHGTLALTASVTDVPGRADRRISVAITVTVTGFPGTPGRPTATPSSGTLAVSWGAAAPNGAPVEYYTVYTDGAPHRCPASPCTITGLHNGTVYTVYVTATNSAGASRQHSPATTAEPNAVPGQVTGVTTSPSNGKIKLSWSPARSVGTPPTSYQVEMSSGPGSQPLTTLGVVTSHTFTGLTNGTTYQFRVRAINQLRSGVQGYGPWSGWVQDIPYGKPLTMSAPTVSPAPVPNPTATRAITVSWPAVQGTDANGRPVTSYTVSEYRATSSGGPWTTVAATQTVNASVTSVSFTVTNDSSYYEYTVSAENQAGWSKPSPLSSPAVQAAAPPSAPTGVSAAATGQDNTIKVGFTPGAPNAKQISSIEYGLNAESSSGTLTGTFTAGTAVTTDITSAMNSGIANGTPVTVYIGECNDAGMCTWDATPSGSVTPYGPIPTPAVTATRNGTSVNYTWSEQADGLTETLNVCINGGCKTYQVSPTSGYSGSSSVNYGYSKTGTITAYATDTAGQRAPASGTVSASATTAPPPPPSPTVSVTKGNVENGGNVPGGCAGNAGCYDFYVKVANFNAGATLTYSCIDGTTWWTSSKSWSGSTVKANNSFYTGCLHYPDGTTVTIKVTDGKHTASGSYKT